MIALASKKTICKYDEEISANSFERIWNEIIEPLIEDYKKECLIVQVRETAYSDIWENYLDFKNHARKNYMANPDGLLDRHKVAACMIFSIIKSGVILSSNQESQIFSSINEDLALTTGLSLLRAFVISAILEGKFDKGEKQQFIEKFNDGFKYPPCFHGCYRDNFLTELHFTKIENNYNILSLANSLFLLETYTRLN